MSLSSGVFSQRNRDVPLIWGFSKKLGCPSHLGFSHREIGMSLSSGFFLREIGMSLSSGVFSQRKQDVPLIWGFLSEKSGCPSHLGFSRYASNKQQYIQVY